MPISRTDFERGAVDAPEMERKVLAVLSESPDEAFTALDVLQKLHPSPPMAGFWLWGWGAAGGIGSWPTFWGIGQALESLVQKGRARMKFVQASNGTTTQYYIFVK